MLFVTGALEMFYDDDAVTVSSQMLKLSETVNDMVAYTKVNDSLFLRIVHSTEPELEEARRILEKVERRRVYRFIGQTNPKPGREDVMVTTVYYFSLQFNFRLYFDVGSAEFYAFVMQPGKN